MKKLFVLAAALLTLSAVGQTKEEEAVQKKLERNNLAIQDAKKSLSVKTWVDRADIYVDAATIYTNKLIAGFTAEPILAMLGTVAGSETATVAGIEMTKFTFPYVEVYVATDGTIQYWRATKEYLKDALSEAYSSLVRAKEISPKDFARRGAATVARLDNQYQTDARSAYGLGLMETAASLFEGSYHCKELIGIVDTTSLFYAAVSFFEAEQHQAALTRFEKVLSYDYTADGSIYYYIATCQELLGQKEKAIATFETGFQKFPNNQPIMAGLINIYMAENKNPEQLITILETAKALDPKNVSLYLVESNVWAKLGQKEKADSAMARAIEIAPREFNVYYNYAILKILEAEGIMAEANKLDLNDIKNYNAMMAMAVEAQKFAISKLEIAYEINPESESAIDLLRQLYFPRRDDSPEMLERYKFFDELHKTKQQPTP